MVPLERVRADLGRRRSVSRVDPHVDRALRGPGRPSGDQLRFRHALPAADVVRQPRSARPAATHRGGLRRAAPLLHEGQRGAVGLGHVRERRPARLGHRAARRRRAGVRRPRPGAAVQGRVRRRLSSPAGRSRGRRGPRQPGGTGSRRAGARRPVRVRRQVGRRRRRLAGGGRHPSGLAAGAGALPAGLHAGCGLHVRRGQRADRPGRALPPGFERRGLHPRRGPELLSAVSPLSARPARRPDGHLLLRLEERRLQPLPHLEADVATRWRSTSSCSTIPGR
ncbi:MAG: hypothetical protein MZV64_42830 [Ignavibacteriales bacterium]|nr:hypothetical protein [Ignavibacteriales bacterium]